MLVGVAVALDKPLSWCDMTLSSSPNANGLSLEQLKTSTKHVANFVPPLHHSHSPHPHTILGTDDLHTTL